MTEKAFIAIAETSRFASRFVSGLDSDTDFFLSYGLMLPDISSYKTVGYWSAGGYAARLRRIGMAEGFTAPGQAWLSTVDESLTGREIVTGGVTAMPEGVQMWAKPAEAKIDAMIAGRYMAEEVRSICEQENVPAGTMFQWTETFMSINHEHRFYVANGRIVTGSPYLIDGTVYHESMSSPFYDEALRAGRNAVTKLGENQPAAYTLDMGLDESTGKWIIVEANPAWSSGIYGCDPRIVMDTLYVACNNYEKKWRWEPAAYLMEKAFAMEPLAIVDPDNCSGVWKYEQ